MLKQDHLILSIKPANLAIPQALQLSEKRGYYIFAAKNLIVNQGKVLAKAGFTGYQVFVENPESMKEILQYGAYRNI